MTTIDADEAKAIFRRTHNDLLVIADRLYREPIETARAAAVERHNVADFFSSQAKRYVINQTYRSIHTKEMFKSERSLGYKHHQLFRYGHLPTNLPLPLKSSTDGECEYHASPIGIMLWYDRRRNEERAQSTQAYATNDWPTIAKQTMGLAIEALWLGSERAGRWLFEAGRIQEKFESDTIGEAFFGEYDRDGNTIYRYEVVQAVIGRYRLYADPTGLEAACMVFDCTPETIPADKEPAFWFCVTAVDDFADRWQRGEWWNAKTGTNTVLRRALGV